MKKRYEHTHVTTSQESLDFNLKDYEDAGWELASAVPIIPEHLDDRYLFILFFKRPVEESGDL